ncbi:hypothetical protein ACFXNR_002508 [Klebsiella oxytoca]|nr:hypothetical protein [Klebsiella oxytoca]HCB1840149.1 hypothetical protein [Klebsiella oxytoca]HCB1894651.1 hypothetical protein [Klebsiella oxytoca]HDX4247054.1 hypothetical protein [Klebsiella oxytoca]
MANQVLCRMTASALSAWRWLCVFLPARAALSRATGSPPSFPMALCMTGLRVYRHLRTRSPARRVKRRLRGTARNVVSDYLPGGAALTGYGFTTI